MHELIGLAVSVKTKRAPPGDGPSGCVEGRRDTVAVKAAALGENTTRLSKLQLADENMGWNSGFFPAHKP